MKILVINFMHLGDLMLMTPMLKRLRESFKEDTICLFVDRILRDVVSENPNIDKLYTLDKRLVGNPANFIKLINQIRKMKFDLVINCHRNERASSIAAFSGAKKIAGYSKPGFSLFFDDVINNEAVAHHVGLFGKTYKPGWIHQVKSYNDILRKCLKIKVDDNTGIFIKPPQKAVQKIDKILKTEFDDKKIIALNVGASWETKRYIFSYFAEIADTLINEGYMIAFLGGDMDKGFVEETVGFMKTSEEKREESLRILTGRLTLGEVAAFLQKASLFITTDSGPMHIGVGVNVPIVTMFGASPVPGFYPYTEKAVLIAAKEDCAPCGNHICKHNDFNCMRNILPEVVLKAAHTLLEKYGGEPAEKLPPSESFTPEFW